MMDPEKQKLVEAKMTEEDDGNPTTPASKPQTLKP